MSKLAKFALLLGVAVALIYLNPGSRVEDLGPKLAADNVVVMYSLTTCPYCTKMRALLKRSGVPFVEYFLDIDPPRLAEFNRLLAANGALPGSVGTPSFVVNGVFLPNNPGLDAIRRNLKFKPR